MSIRNLKDKTALRNELKERLAHIGKETLQEKSRSLSIHLNTLLHNLNVIQDELNVGSFYPIQKEPIWFLELDKQFLDNLSFPLLSEKKGSMTFKKCKLEELVVETKHGISLHVPSNDAIEVSPQVIILPGLGFDSTTGNRLGRGQGYYDRYLNNTDVIKIGICISEQLCESIITDVHDVNMNYVVTEKQIFKIE